MKLNRRLSYLLGIAIILGVVAVGFGDQIANRVTATLLLRQISPDAVAVQSVFHAARDPLSMVQRFWETQRLPHRSLAVSFLKDQSNPTQPLPAEAKTLLIEALTDVDVSVRELAMGALAKLEPKALLQHLPRQLHDTDHAIRLQALHQIKANDFKSLTANVVSLLDDPEPLVIASAAGLLRQWTGEDFQVRNHLAVSQETPEGPRRVPQKNLETLQQGVARWKTWWEKNHTTYPPAKPRDTSVTPPRLPTDDFELQALEGRPVRLSDFQGKTVLLNFWTTWCTACAMEMPDLVALDKNHGEDLVILGVSLDGSDGHGHDHASFVDLEEASEKGWESVEGYEAAHEHDHEHGHDGHNHKAAGPDLEKIKKKIHRIVQKKGLSYQILLNPTGDIGNRFNGHELPTNVLIDKDGFVRRRFIGSRPLVTWEALIAEIR